MTPEQITLAFDAATQDNNKEDTGVSGIDGMLHFSTLEELQLWRESRG